MKKLLIVAVMALAAISASAQWYAGGSVGLWRNSSANETTFNLLPEIGYNISDDVAVGTTIGWYYNYDNGLKVNLFMFDPYVRYSFYQNDKVKVFCDGGIDLGIGWAKYGDETSDTACTYGFGFKPGISYAIADNMSLVAHFGFLGYRGGNDASGADDEFGFDFSNSISFGFYVNF